VAKRVQFNVRIRREVADGLRDEAKRRDIGPGELLEELATAHRAEVQPGVWVDLEPTLERALLAVAAAEGLTSEALLKRIVGTYARDSLRELAASVPALEPIDDDHDDLLDLFDDDGDVPDETPEPARRTRDDTPVERRRRPRRTLLTDAERAELAALPLTVPRTGDALRTWRRDRRLDQQALGDLCGVSRVAVGLWEAKGPLPAPILLKLGRHLPLESE